MNISVNGNNNTFINLENATTFGELRDALPATGVGRVPGVEQLQKKAEVLLRKYTPSGKVTIFDNGFFTFEECGRVTVWGVDRCEWSELYSETGRTRVKEKKKEDFGSYPWELILEAAGSARLSHNADSREEYQSMISLDAPESADKLAFSTCPVIELQEREEAEKEWKEIQNNNMKGILGTLTEKQYQIVILHRVKKMTQEQISDELGISRRTVREHLEAIDKKLNKFSRNTRH